MEKEFLLFCLLLLSCSCTENRKQKNSLTYLDSKSIPVIEGFFQNVRSNKYKIAVNELLSKNENIDLQDSITISLQRKFNDINEQSGRFVSEKLVREKKLNDDLGVYSYLVKYDRKFYRFVFTFYNNGKEVKIFKFSFDDNIDLELEESIKLYVG